MNLGKSKVKTYQMLMAQIIAIVIWMSITIIQWVKNPKSSQGLLIPLIVRSIEFFDYKC